MKCFVIGYTAKNDSVEFSSCYGLKLDGESLPSFDVIRSKCLDWANRDGASFSYMQINFITQMDESDYNSFMGLGDK